MKRLLELAQRWTRSEVLRTGVVALIAVVCGLAVGRWTARHSVGDSDVRPIVSPVPSQSVATPPAPPPVVPELLDSARVNAVLLNISKVCTARQLKTGKRLTRDEVAAIYNPLRREFSVDRHLLFQVLISQANKLTGGNWPDAAETLTEARELLDEIKADWQEAEMRLLLDLASAAYATGDEAQTRQVLQTAVEIPDLFRPTHPRSDKKMELHYEAALQLVRITPIEEVHRIDGLDLFVVGNLHRDLPEKAARMSTLTPGVAQFRKRMEFYLTLVRNRLDATQELHHCFDVVLKHLQSEPLRE